MKTGDMNNNTLAFSALDNIDAIVLIADSKGDIVYLNKAVQRILGYEPGQIIGDGWWKLISDDNEERKNRKAVIAGMAAGQIDVRDRPIYETAVKKKDGKIIWLQWTNSRAQGNYLIGVGQVVTEKKEIEEKLKRYAAQVELLHAIDKHILSMRPLEERIELVLLELEKNISFVCRATLGVFNTETGNATMYRRGKVKETFTSGKKEVPLSAIRSISHFRPGNYFIARDLRSRKNLSETDKENIDDGIYAYLALPLYYRDKLNGALFLCSDIADPFSEQDIVLAQDVANSLSIAIEQKQLEQSLIKKNAEKELLLKEIHHRVKNNLQVISSLLNLQSSTLSDPGALEAFQKSKDRINAMALIHTKLYESGNLSEINFEEYLRQLVSSIAVSYGNDKTVECKVDAKNIVLDVDTSINLGLIVTELGTNAFKHAFKDRKNGKVTIEVNEMEGGKIQLKVSDNGIGLPKNFKPGKTNSLGLEIVQALSGQLEGKLDFYNKKGAVCSITFRPSGKHKHTE